MEEQVIWSGSPSQIKNLGIYIFCGLMLLTVYLIPVAIILAGYHYLNVKNTKITITDQRIKVSEGVFTKRINDLELYRVRDISYESPFIFGLFGLASVYVFSTDLTSRVLKIDAIPNAQAVYEEIRKYAGGQRRSNNVRSVEW